MQVGNMNSGINPRNLPNLTRKGEINILNTQKLHRLFTLLFIFIKNSCNNLFSFVLLAVDQLEDDLRATEFPWLFAIFATFKG